MKKLNIYNVYIDDSEAVYKVVTPAENEEEARARWQGNGEIVTVKEIECPINIEFVHQALAAAGFGQTEQDVITRTLTLTGIAR